MTVADAVPQPSPQLSTAVERWLAKQTGVVIGESSTGRVIGLPASLGKTVNLLLPSSQIVQVVPDYSPVPRMVHLDIEAHTYPESGKRALTAKALALLADSAGIQFLDPRIDYMGGRGVSFTARARRRGSDGTWDVRSATKVVRFEQLERKTRRERAATIAKWSDPPTGEALEEMLVKAVDETMEYVDGKCETKAMARVIRHWLNVKATYTNAELAKPFLVVAWVVTPDYSNPHVAKIIDANFNEGRHSLYAVAPAEPAHVSLVAGADLPDYDDAQLDAMTAPVIAEHDILEGEVIDADAELDEDFTAPPTPPPPATLALDLGEDLSIDGPPRPKRSLTFHQGPYEGIAIDAVLEEPEGMQYVADRAAAMRPNATRELLAAWLSHAEGIYLLAEDLPAFADRLREEQA